MRTQIRTLQVPTRNAGAFMPVPAANSTAEFNGQNIITGYPGNRAVPSPRPAAMRDGSWGGQWQNSSQSPDYLLPSIYTVRLNNTMLFNGDVRITNVSPVPATGIGATVRALFNKPVIGGSRVTRAVRPFTQWATYGSGASN